jgi:hypothetical protein
MSQPTKAIAVSVVKAPALKNGGDAANAKQLDKLFSEAQNGMRRIVALGLFAWELKETQLKHGEFGAWLAAHCPKLATLDSVTGKPRASRALSGYMELTKGVLESVGFKTVGKYLGEAGKCANDAHLGGGKFLLIADKKVPADLKPLREKIFALVDGKTQRSLFMEFKQAEDDDDGNPKVKRGQLKGSKGLTKEQREAAKLREEQERIEDLELAADETAQWLEKNCDDKNVGAISPKKAERLLEAVQYAQDYLTNLSKQRKGQ